MTGSVQVRAVQAGMYLSALSMLAAAPMSDDEKERQYRGLLSAARVFLAGFSVEIPDTFREFLMQGDWQSRVLESLRALDLNRLAAFGMALHAGQIDPAKAKPSIFASGSAVGLTRDTLSAFVSRLVVADLQERNRLIDEFIDKYFAASASAQDIPSSLESAFFQTFWPASRTWRASIVLIAVLALAVFGIWVSLPDTTKVDVIDSARRWLKL